MATTAWTLLFDGSQHTIASDSTGARPTIALSQLGALLGWEWHENALCRADRCIPLGNAEDIILGEAVDLQALVQLIGMPIAIEPSRHLVALAASPVEQGSVLRGGQAPDFTLADLNGDQHSLREYRGQKVLLVTWASWCGCREDLGAWQAQYRALREHGLVVLTVSQDARTEDARPFIEAAAPEHPALLDPDHIVSHRYGFINVPTAVWIDEHGKIARPPRVEHATNTFAFAHGLDCEPHLTALQRWAQSGVADFTPEETRRTTLTPSADEQTARAHHALAWHLHKIGASAEAASHWAEAIRLSPHDWTIRRGSMWLRGANPFGAEFAEAWMEWENAGRPDYISLANARTEGAAL